MSLASYNQLIADVYTLTARPDLVAETALAVRKATMKAHLADFWVNDIIQALPVMPVISPGSLVSYRYTLDLTNAVTYPFFRKITSVKEYNNPLTGQEIQFKSLDPTNLLDSYRLEDINYYSQLGRSVSIRCNKALGTLAVNYYAYPDVTPATYNSWVADQFPDLIVEEATATIFNTVGKDAEAKKLRDNFAENMHFITMSQIVS